MKQLYDTHTSPNNVSVTFHAKRWLDPPTDMYLSAAILLSRKWWCSMKMLVPIIAPVKQNIRSHLICSSLYSQSHANAFTSALRKRLDAGLAKAYCRRLTQFSCYHRSRQPTYRELFKYASDQPDGKFKGSIVILGNGSWRDGPTASK